MDHDKLLLHIYKQLVDMFENEIYVKNRQGAYVVVNDYYKIKLVKLGILSSVDDTMVGLTDYDLYPKEMADKFYQNDCSVMDANEESTIQESIRLGDDNNIMRFISHKKPACDLNGSVIGVIGSSVEITDIKLNSRNVQLTKREIECLSGIFYGMTANEIADKLFISRRTAECHIKNLKFKLDCKKRSDIMSLVLDNNLEKVLKHHRLV